MHLQILLSAFALLVAMCVLPPVEADVKSSPFRLAWDKNFLTISGETIPGGEVRVMYLEAYCRPGSTDRDWGETTIGHTTELVDASKDGKTIRLKCTLNDGVIVTHTIRAVADGVEFDLMAKNPTQTASLAHCIDRGHG